MATGYSTKIYIVQLASGEVIAAKTAFMPAHEIAKAHAPAQVLFSVADKSSDLNVVGHATDNPECK